jgi:hypothetical protein
LVNDIKRVSHFSLTQFSFSSLLAFQEKQEE